VTRFGVAGMECATTLGSWQEVAEQGKQQAWPPSEYQSVRGEGSDQMTQTHRAQRAGFLCICVCHRRVRESGSPERDIRSHRWNGTCPRWQPARVCPVLFFRTIKQCTAADVAPWKERGLMAESERSWHAVPAGSGLVPAVKHLPPLDDHCTESGSIRARASMSHPVATPT